VTGVSLAHRRALRAVTGLGRLPLAHHRNRNRFVTFAGSSGNSHGEPALHKWWTARQAKAVGMRDGSELTSSSYRGIRDIPKPRARDGSDSEEAEWI
jgi:hypothetical protein